MEIQTYPEIFFTKRLVAYTSRVYSEQLDRSKKYGKLNSVYCMAFSTVNLDCFRGSKRHYHTAGILTFEAPHLVVDDSIQFIFVELGKFRKGAEELVDKQEAWCYLLKKSHEMGKSEFEAIKGKGDDMRQAVERLHKLSADGHTYAEIEAYEKQRKIQITEREAAWEKGIEKGKREIALQMLADGESIAKICKYTGLTGEQVEALKKQS